MSELPLIDRMEMMARHSGKSREEFASEFDDFLNGPAQLRCYVFKGPDWLCFARHIDPSVHPGAPGEAWLIYYYYDAQERGYRRLFRLVDALLYPLPYAAFSRPLKGRKELQFFKWERIRRLCEAPSALLSGS